MSVAITGYGAVSGFGFGVPALRAAFSGADCLRPIRRFETRRGEYGGIVEDGVALDEEARVFAYAAAAAREALLDASVTRLEPRTMLLVGLSLVDGVGYPDRLAERLGDALGVPGARLAFTTACAASTAAMAAGRELLLSGGADLVLAGGADMVTRELFWGFSALGVLAPEKCRPFGRGPGVVLSDGAAFLVLERAQTAVSRSARVRGWLSGTALSNDGFHESSPDPSGARLGTTLAAAVRDAAVPLDAIGAFSAHGTGTLANDAAEWQGVLRAFGPLAETLPVSAPKALIGHAHAAAGALEVVLALIGLETGQLLPAPNTGERRPRGPTRLITEPTTERHQAVISANAAFGGANAVIVLTDRPTTAACPSSRRIRLLGSGVTSAKGDLAGQSVDPTRLAHTLRRLDLRGATPAIRFLTAAAALALDAAGLRGSDRIGLFAGITTLSIESHRRFRTSIRERGLERLDVTTVPHLVPNAAPGGAARILGLRGPHLVLASGATSSLAAVALACDALCRRDDASAIVCGASDEPADEGDSEGGACVVVGLESDEVGERPLVSGWSLGAPGDLTTTTALALSMSGLGSVDRVVTTNARALVSALLGVDDVISVADVARSAPALASALALVLGAESLAEPECRAVLVAGDSGCASVAIVLRRAHERASA